jgi:tetratricopeptide (TPR) repeat protein
MNRNTAIHVLLATALLAGLGADLRADTLRKTDGRAITGGRIKWQESRREYRIEMPDGSIVSVPVDDVEAVEVAKPAEFDKATQAMAAKQYAVAISLLEDLVIRFKRLQWDASAREVLATAYYAKGDYKKAVQIMGELMKDTPKNMITDEQYGAYWNALIGAQMTADLKKALSEAIAGDSKKLAALAVVRRGDLAQAEGKREDAVLDYLRAVVLYEEAKETHPEALYKAAQLLGEMRDPRADELKKKLVTLYPGSGYAKKLGGQM